MIVGIGCDLLANMRLQKALQESGPQFLRRLCHIHELQREHANEEQKLRYFCHLWSIKEACSKALGTGITGLVTLSSIEVSCASDRAPIIILHQGAQQALQNLVQAHNSRQHRIYVSVSDEESFTVAMVIIECL